MHRYDRGWNRRYGHPGWVPYDRLYRSGDAAWANGLWSPAGWRADERSTSWARAYDRWLRTPQPGERRPRAGGYGGPQGQHWGSQGYDRGSDFGYAHRGQHGRGWEGGWDYSERRPFRDYYDARFRRGSYGRWVGGAESWDLPPGYVDEGIDDFFDDEEDDDLDATGTEAWWDEQDDGQLRELVMRSLRSDGFLNAHDIQVEARDGVVTLRGRVQDYMESRYAWDDAWEVPGVRGVINKLEVSTGDATPNPSAGAVAPSGKAPDGEG